MATIVSVSDLALSARIGINPDELDRRQPLIISVDLDIDDAPGIAGGGITGGGITGAGITGAGITGIVDTVDYRCIVAAAQAIGDRHIGMIEQFARLLAERCLTMGPVRQATVHVAKPQALPQGRASVRVTLRQQD